MLSNCVADADPALSLESRKAVVDWSLMGTRVCEARLVKLLGTSPGTFCKRRNGQIDKRGLQMNIERNQARCGNQDTASESVNIWFLQMWLSAAEVSPNPHARHTPS